MVLNHLVTKRASRLQQAQALGKLVQHTIAPYIPPPQLNDLFMLILAAFSTLGDAGKSAISSRPAEDLLQAEEWLELRREEDRHRPTAVPVIAIAGRHVDLVEVRALSRSTLMLTKSRVHGECDVGVQRTCTFHNMTPVTCRVANRQEGRLLYGFRPGEHSLPHGYQSTGLVSHAGAVARAGFTGQPSMVFGGRRPRGTMSFG